jgi:predicted XRE-type DNA-binding protein
MEQLRIAIAQSERSQYAISKSSGVPRSTIHRFMDGTQELGADTIQKLCDDLGLVIVLKPAKKRK